MKKTITAILMTGVLLLTILNTMSASAVNENPVLEKMKEQVNKKLNKISNNQEAVNTICKYMQKKNMSINLQKNDQGKYEIKWDTPARQLLKFIVLYSFAIAIIYLIVFLTIYFNH